MHRAIKYSGSAGTVSEAAVPMKVIYKQIYTLELMNQACAYLGECECRMYAMHTSRISRAITTCRAHTAQARQS
jgi:hypothetical protein